MLLASSVQNILSRPHENSPTKPGIFSLLSCHLTWSMWKKRTSKHTFSPNVEKGSQVMAKSTSELELAPVHSHT